MTLLVIEGFDNVGTTGNYAIKRTFLNNGYLGLIDGRFGGKSMHAAAGPVFTLDKMYDQIIVGFALRDGRSPITREIFRFRNVGSTQLEVYRDINGAVYFARNGTLVGSKSSNSVLKNSVWQYLEARAQISDSTTVNLEIRVDGVTVLTLPTGLDAKNLSTTGVDSISFDDGASVNGLYIDDLYILSPSGRTQTFLGDCRVMTLFPSGAGSSTSWTPSAGSNWQCVDENSPDGDTTYVSSSTLNHIDLYNIDNVSTSGSIIALQTTAVTKKDDAGTYQIQHTVRVSGVNYTASGDAVSSSYSYSMKIFEDNPYTSGAWSYGDVNNMELGIKLSSTGSGPVQGGGA